MWNKRLSKVWPGCALLLFALASDPGKLDGHELRITGKVTTPGGTPVKHALVRFIDQADTTFQFSSMTNDSGKYEILITAVGTRPDPVRDFRLSPSYPNPFWDTTTIPYVLDEPSQITVEIYDILGRLVRTYHQPTSGAGPGQVVWDGRNEKGGRVASGIYFCRLITSRGSEVAKVAYFSGPIPGRQVRGNNHPPARTSESSRWSDSQRTLGGSTYTARLENNSSTLPRVVPIKRENIVVEGDTARIDLQVEPLYHNTAVLENQSEHSGIMVKVAELDTFVVTDSLGLFVFEQVPDGMYTLEARYPYFESVVQNVSVQGGFPERAVTLQLKQLLQFWIEPAETTISMSNMGNPDFFWLGGFRQYCANISDAPVTVSTTYEPIFLWALAPQGFDWPYLPNPDNWPDMCYEIYGWFGANILFIDFWMTIHPGDTLSMIVPHGGNTLGKDCVKAGTYLFFSAISDYGSFREYFDAGYFMTDTLPYPQAYNPLTRTLLRKRELFRPAIVHLTEYGGYRHVQQ